MAADGGSGGSNVILPKLMFDAGKKDGAAANCSRYVVLSPAAA
jgi:hypothetical protein